MSLYLIRHGQTDWNAARRVQGREDIPLNAAGFAQARAAAQALQAGDAVRILTGPLLRARQTADTLAAVLHLPAPVVEPGLTERDYGPLTGLPYGAGQDLYSFTEHHPDGMETLEQVRDRALPVLQQAGCLPGSSILVSHGGTINILLWAVTGGRLGYGVTRLQNACISVLESRADGGFTVTACNLTAAELQLPYPAERPEASENDGHRQKNLL